MKIQKRRASTEDDNEIEPLVEINMVPMIDVMLVLLIIFMVAAPLSLNSLKVNLPRGKGTRESVDEKKIVLTIKKSGEYFFGKEAIQKEKIGTHLERIYETRKNKNLYVNADKHVLYERVVYAISIAKASGVQKIAMLTQGQK